ncbi:MAG: RNA-binding transcriptional accessory protein [Bacteroidales bacterium]|nr:RNA-binding transcriptional accessory protein [Bacteroidales bacterium]
MNDKYIKLIADKLGIREIQVKNTAFLFSQGATVPFISRYRKEATGTLNEVQVAQIKDELKKYEDLDKRRDSIIESIESQGKMTSELKQKLEDALDITTLEDLYLPYKQKKKTRASMAREKGLEPLANLILLQQNGDIELCAEKYLNDNVETVEDALQGARDIIAEHINENVDARNKMRNLFNREAIIYSKLVAGKETEGQKYKDYFDYSEKLSRIAGHRLMALMRGENEGFLKITIQPAEENALNILNRQFVRGRGEASKQVEIATEDCYKRLLRPSIETEFSHIAKDKADEEAINVFTENLRNLLLASPLGKKRILALDPGFRTGCKLVCLDEQGNLLHNEAIYPHSGNKEAFEAMKKVTVLSEQYKIDCIAIGNGTASRETERFIKKIRFNRDINVYIVSESGASIYSASEVAREEFPNYDLTVRGAVSIGRRLLDPLAELVKIDPKSIGVGQYQHDVNQTKLKESLDNVVVSCVNQVGVNVNTASKHLLMYVSGLGPTLAQNIVDYRKENGPFNTRAELKKVPRMGDKAYEQCAGFLRIDGAKNPLDNSAVHPEKYYIVNKMAKDLGCEVIDLVKNADTRKKIDIAKYVDEKTGIPTLTDIMQELEKPGRDPRGIFKAPEFEQNVETIKDLKVGMELNGIVTNVTNFGAFVDLGIHINGLIHVSQMGDGKQRVTNPATILKIHQPVKVRITDVDIDRERISLSMKGVKQEF